MPTDQLDPDRLRGQTAMAAVEYHAEIDSTNDRAKLLAAQGGPVLPLLVVAERQTAGRGREARDWWTGEGNLAFTLLARLGGNAGEVRPGTVPFFVADHSVSPNNVIDEKGDCPPRAPHLARPQPPGRVPLVAFAPALAVVEAVLPRLAAAAGWPLPPLGIHWPNDVIARGKKLCGVLVEALPGRLYAIGVGLNVNATCADAPEPLRPILTTLHELTGRTHDRTELLIDVLGRLDYWLRLVEQTPEQVARQADALCLQKGRDVSFQLGPRRVAGKCLGIAADGGLVVEAPGGREVVHSGTPVIEGGEA